MTHALSLSYLLFIPLTVAVVVIPITIIVDVIGNAIGVGTNALTFGLDSSELGDLLLMYGVLLLAQICTQILVQRTLRNKNNKLL